MKIAPTSPSADVLNNGSGVIFTSTRSRATATRRRVELRGQWRKHGSRGILTPPRCGAPSITNSGEHVELCLLGNRTAGATLNSFRHGTIGFLSGSTQSTSTAC